MSRKNHDEFGWTLCHQKERHQLEKLFLALFITKPVFGLIDILSHKIRNTYQIRGICECGHLDDSLNMDIKQLSSGVDMKTQFSHVPQQWFSDDKLLILTDPKCKENIDLFQIDWLKGYVS